MAVKVNNWDLPNGCYECPFNGLSNYFGQFRPMCLILERDTNENDPYNREDDCPLERIEDD